MAVWTGPGGHEFLATRTHSASLRVGSTAAGSGRGGGHRNRANVFVGGKAGEDRVAEALPLRGGRDTLGKAGEGERLRG